MVKQLEKKLGVLLFERAQRPLSLTPAGMALQRKSDLILDQIDSIPAALRQAAHQRLPEIRVGLVDTFAANAGAAFVKKLMGAAARVHVESGSAPRLNDAFLSRRLDIVLTTEGIDDIDGLSREEIWREPLILVTPTHDPLWAASKTLPELVTKGPLVRYTARSQLGIQIERHLRRLGLAPIRHLELESSEALLAMVADGVGWAITTPLCLLQGQMHLPRIAVKPLPRPGAFRSFFIIGRTNEHENSVDEFASIARRILKNGVDHKVKELWPWLGAAASVCSGKGEIGSVVEGGIKEVRSRLSQLRPRN